jgi:hypothetical protein
MVIVITHQLLVVPIKIVMHTPTVITVHAIPISILARKFKKLITHEMSISDRDFEILQIYSGKASENITVMQTRGIDFTNPELRTEMHDDPLYKIEDE